MSQEQSMVEACHAQLDGLSAEGKVLVLEHLIGQLGAAGLELLSPDALEKLRGVLPVPEGVRPKASISRGQMARACNLQVEDIGRDRRVTFTIPEGVETLRDLLQKIEAANPRAKGDGVIWPASEFLLNHELDKKVTPGTEYNMTICFWAINMTRSEHEDYLKGMNLSFTERSKLGVAAALYRDEYGFPPKRKNIGTERDPGDLFKGRVVRARFGAAASYGNGVYVAFYCSDGRYSNLVVAGSSLLNQ